MRRRFDHARIGAPEFGRLAGDAERNFRVLVPVVAVVHPINLAVGHLAVHEHEQRIGLRLDELEVRVDLEWMKRVGIGGFQNFDGGGMGGGRGVTGALKAGANTLDVKVANTWVNRIVGDQQPGATKITTVQSYRADSPLLPSGLLGPVKRVSLTK